MGLGEGREAGGGGRLGWNWGHTSESAKHRRLGTVPTRSQESESPVPDHWISLLFSTCTQLYPTPRV